MLKMFHYMKERWYYLVMILLLLFVQAFCDLSLPDYTSDIINVGIQQKGIEDGVPEKLREESADKLFLFMDQEDREQVQEDYTLTNGMYELKDISSEEREELNNILGVPELIVTGLSDPSSKEVAQIKEQMGLDQDTDIFQILEQIPKEQLSRMLSGMEEQFEQMPDSIVTQSAVLFVQDEYSAQGQDLDQNANALYPSHRRKDAGSCLSGNGSGDHRYLLIRKGCGYTGKKSEKQCVPESPFFFRRRAEPFFHSFTYYQKHQ